MTKAEQKIRCQFCRSKSVVCMVFWHKKHYLCERHNENLKNNMSSLVALKPVGGTKK